MDQVLLSSFKDPVLVRALLDCIEQRADELSGLRAHAGKLDKNGQPCPVRLMEVCGTHTVSIARAGFRSVLPPSIKLISGPGCPVCVTAHADIDRIIALTRIPGVIVATFGDMVRVPGSSTSLQQRKAEGAAVEVVYSPLDAIKLTQLHTVQDVQSARGAYSGETQDVNSVEAQIVLVGVGFETTTPLIASTIERADELKLRNFSVLAIHKRVPPALRALACDEEVALDALILPGHVSTILGVKPYEFLADEFNIPACITGFEPVDILQGIAQLLEQLIRIETVDAARTEQTDAAQIGHAGVAQNGHAGAAQNGHTGAAQNGHAGAACTKHEDKAHIEIAYKRAVMYDGNPTARAAIDRVFEMSEATWRGLGAIPQSGYTIRSEYASFDASRRFAHQLEELQEATVEPRGCKCPEVLRGVMAPNNCPLFGKACTPQNPVGPCMVSTEGSCAAYYRYALT